MAERNPYSDSLLDAYSQCICQNPLPEWAVHKRTRPMEIVHPTIPFIGNQYGLQQKKILLYASAENLADYYYDENGKPGGSWNGNELDDDLIACNRHRYWFDRSNSEETAFYPHVHIGPMNDGFLALATCYIAASLGMQIPKDPRSFYEMISFGNYGKFSIETPRQKTLRLGFDYGKRKDNQDYAADSEKLMASHCFIERDLNALSPNILIMPMSIFRADKQFIERKFSGERIIPIYQINARVINTLIKKKYNPIALDKLSPTLQNWYNHLNNSTTMNRTKENYLRLFPYIDEVLQQCSVE